MTQDDAAVRLAGVGHRYGALQALQDIDLRVAAGSVTGFIGPDGVGKSTLLSLVAGARRLQHGELDVLCGDMR